MLHDDRAQNAVQKRGLAHRQKRKGRRARRAPKDFVWLACRCAERLRKRALKHPRSRPAQASDAARRPSAKRGSEARFSTSTETEGSPRAQGPKRFCVARMQMRRAASQTGTQAPTQPTSASERCCTTTERKTRFRSAV